MIRGPYSHEPARLEVCLLGMQGLGEPGVHQHADHLFRHAARGGLVGSSCGTRKWSSGSRCRPVFDFQLAGIGPAQDAGSSRISADREPLKFTGCGAIESPIAEPIQGAYRSPCRARCRADTDDVDRHALPDHLLERRQRYRRRAPHSRKWNASSRSIPGWKTTASFPTSSCPPTPTWKWTTSSPTSGRAAQFADVMLCEKAVEPDRGVQERLRDRLEIAKKLGLEEAGLRGPHHRGHSKEGLRIHGPGEIHDLGRV